MPDPSRIIDSLCLHCGLCCNGALFSAVELQPEDDAGKLKTLGLPVRMIRRRPDVDPGKPDSDPARGRFPQPCLALGPDCRCRLYQDRPTYCRQFECALFKEVCAGKQSVQEALRLIRTARRRVARVRRLMRQLGDTDEHLALRDRFRRLRRRIETAGVSPAAQELFHQLTLAVHRLNLLLGGRFYPDPMTGPAS